MVYRLVHGSHPRIRMLAAAAAVAAIGSLSAGSSVSAFEAPISSEEDPFEGNLEICHATGSGYSTPEPANVSGIISAHSGDTGTHGGDIIPPVWYVNDEEETVFYEGKNWDATGQEIYENDCVVPAATTSTVAGSTTTVAGSTTTVAGTTTTVAGATTTAPDYPPPPPPVTPTPAPQAPPTGGALPATGSASEGIALAGAAAIAAGIAALTLARRRAA